MLPLSLAYQSTTTLPGPVLTNAPTLDWHLGNLPNYANLGVVNVPQSFFGQELNGSGFRGLPGDGTPPSRFVRASTMLETMYQPQSLQQSVGLALQLIEACATPYGTIATMVTDVETISECSQWITLRDHQNLGRPRQQIDSHLPKKLALCFDPIDDFVPYRLTLDL